MQAALRPYATAGVALVGASVIAVSPVMVTPSAVDEAAREASVQLSALANPIDVFGPIFQSTVENLQAVATQFVDDPAPILTQIIKNQINGIGNIGGALEAQVGALPELPRLLGPTLGSELENLGTIGGLSQEFLQNVLGTITGGALQEQIQLAIDTARGGDLGGAFANLAAVPLLLIAGEGLENLLVVLPQFIPALQQPLADAARLFPIAAGPLANGEAAIAAVSNSALILGVGVLSPLIGLASATGDTLDGLIEAAQSRDPELAFNTLVNQAGVATSAVLDGALNPSFGIAAGVQALRQAIAAAIASPTFPPQSAVADVAKVPGTGAQSFTLTTPQVKALPAPKAVTPSVVDSSAASGTDTKDTPTDATSTDTKDTSTDTKAGNLFTPGSSSTKGGRHRAENGPSFGKELRDAAEKTIKNITGLGRSTKSDKETSSSSASKSESGSSSSGSGESGSGGDSGSK